jgi:integrase
VTIDTRTAADGRPRHRPRVRVKDVESGQWETVYGAWTRLRKAAERGERNLLRRRDAGNLAPARGLTVGRYLADEWLPPVRRVSKRGRALAPTTADKYERHVGRITAVIGDVRITDLRPAHVERVRDELLASKLAPQTVADVLRVLAQALGKAEAKGLIARNHAAASIVDRPRGQVRDFAIITPEYGKRILAAARGADPWDAAASLALGLSLRREEVLGLGWDHIDVDTGTIRIERTLTYAGGELHWGPPKSEAGERELPAPEFVFDALRRHRAAQNERRLLYGEAWRDEGLVIDYGDGGPWLPPTFSTYWARFAKRAGFGEVTFHTLRHGTATLLLAAGVPDAVVVQIMGHADTRILRRYQDVIPDLMRDAGERLQALLE